MKALSSVVLVLAICAATVVPSEAAADKLLQNVHGDVSYQQGSGATPLAPNATIALSDNDYAITGEKSLAAISLPDSSKVLVGDNTKLQLAFFDSQPNLTTAKFILYKGKTRFTVEHPGGAKANYTFQTTTGQIAVRGTVGEIYSTDQQLQVACYQLSDPSKPVEVNLNNGKKYTLSAGQTLTVAITGAIIAAAAIGSVSSSMVSSSTATFGAAPGGSAGGAAAGGAAGGAAGTGAAGAAAAPAAAAGAAAAAAAVAVTQTKSTTAPSTPAPSGVVNVSPGSLNFASTGAASQTVTVSEQNYTGTFTLNVTGNAVGTSTSDGVNFKVKPKKVGVANVVAVDSLGNQSSFSATVANTPPIVPATVNVGGAGKTISFTVDDPASPTGPFKLSFNPTGIVQQASSSGSGSAGPRTGSPSGSGSGYSITLMGVAQGTTQMTVTDPVGNSQTTTVNVSSGSISTDPHSFTMHPGETHPIQIDDGYITGPFTASYGSSSGSSSTVVQLVQVGSNPYSYKLKAINPGSTSITIHDCCHNSSAQIPVTVGGGAITVNPNPINVPGGGQTGFTASEPGLPSAKLKFVIADYSVAKLSPSGNAVVAVGSGQTTLTVSDNYGTTPVVVPVNVGSGRVVANPSSWTAPSAPSGSYSPHTTIRLSETNFSGQLNLVTPSSSGGIVTVQRVGSGNSFTVTAIASGSTTLKATDGSSASGGAYNTTNVAIVVPTSIPVCIYSRPHDRRDLKGTQPQPYPSCTPTPTTPGAPKPVHPPVTKPVHPVVKPGPTGPPHLGQPGFHPAPAGPPGMQTPPPMPGGQLPPDNTPAFSGEAPTVIAASRKARRR